MPLIRKQLKPSDVYPDNIRYNPNGDQVEVLIDGVWTPAPESDPRKQTTLPPRVTADTKCDAAQSVADALKGQIDGILTAIDNGSTAFTIVGIILSIFSFGVFAIFVSIALAIADFMIGLGAAAIETALPPSAFEDLRCILYCHMDSNGRIKPGHIPAIQQEIVDAVGAVGGSILNSMIDLAGEGGLNGLASVGTSTGDCSTCDCGGWCYLFNFAINDGGWIKETFFGDDNGIYITSSGWSFTDAVNTNTNPDSANRLVYIDRTFDLSTITKVIVTYDYIGGTYDSNARQALSIGLNAASAIAKTRAQMVDGNGQTFEWTGSVSNVNNINLYLRSSIDIASPYVYSGNAKITSVQIEGTGDNPFGDDNC